jgi:hypothetical protein
MQFSGRPPSGVVFDCDLGVRPATALALDILFALDQKSECRVTAMATSRGHLHSAAYLDSVYRFYAGSGPFVRPMPIGMAAQGPPDPLPMLEAAVGQFPHQVHRMNDTADPYAVLRNGYTAQFDGNALTVLCGPATHLARILDLPGSKELIAQKCKLLVAALDSPRREADPKAAEKLLAEWPSPLVVCESDVIFPAASIPAGHPSSLVCAGDAALPALDCVAVLAAVRPAETYLQYEGAERRRTVTIDPAQRDRVLAVMVEFANAKPQPRTAPPKRPV